MGGEQAYHSSGSDSWENETSDEDGSNTSDTPRVRAKEPYAALPSPPSAASSFPQKAALHLFELFDLSEEETGFSDEELTTADVTLHDAAQIGSDATNNERRTTNEDERLVDDEEDVAALLLADGKDSSIEEEDSEVGTCFPCRRCPCAKNLEKEERAMRWLLLCGFLFCIPWAVAMYLGLCTSRRRNRGLRQIGRFAALLWGLAWIIVIAVSIVVSIILIRVTHILSEKTYGTVAFVGLMPAKTWSDAELLKHVYSLGFDAIALSPPGIGGTTNVTSLKDSFYNDENFLSQVLESCLDIRLASTVVVSHSNIITRQFFFPLLMNTALLGFVLFDSYTGEDWITEVNPALNDHLFYSPKTRNYRYVGSRRLSEELHRSSVGPFTQGTSLAAEGGGKWPTNHSSTANPHRGTQLPPPVAGANKSPARILQAVNCIAAEFNADNEDAWEDHEHQTLGPYQFFPGKYKVPGWGLRQAELLAVPLDPAPDKQSSLLDVLSTTGAGILSGVNGSEEQVESVLEETRLVPSRQTPISYFDPLKDALTGILTEIKDKVDLGTYHPERLPVAFREDRNQAYKQARVKTTLIDPSTIYCLHGSSATDSALLPKSKGNGRSASKDLERTRKEKRFGAVAVQSELDHSAQPESQSTHVNTSSLRGRPYNERPVASSVGKELPLDVDEEDASINAEGPAGYIEYVGEAVVPVNPERFSPEEKQKLLQAYAIRDRMRADERAKRRATSSRLYTAVRPN